jgi:hypothetical protein
VCFKEEEEEEEEEEEDYLDKLTICWIENLLETSIVRGRSFKSDFNLSEDVIVQI